MSVIQSTPVLESKAVNERPLRSLDTDFSFLGHSITTRSAPQKGNKNVGGTTHQTRNTGYWDEIFFEKLYVLPQEFDLGFIVEETEREVFVFSTFEDNKNVSAITEISPEGLILEGRQAPFVFPAFGSELYIIRVLTSGPPIQNTTYVFVIEGQNFAVVVTGKRIVSFIYPVQFLESYRQSYSFQTAIFATERFYEQRRPVLKNSIRRSTSRFYESDKLAAQKFMFDIRELMKGVMAVPVYKERLTNSEDLQGLTTLVCNEDLTNYFDLRNLSTLVLIQDVENLEKSELKEISSINLPNSIVLQNEIVEQFEANSAIIYPVFFGVIDGNPTFRVLNLDKIEITIDFLEVRV